MFMMELSACILMKYMMRGKECGLHTYNTKCGDNGTSTQEFLCVCLQLHELGNSERYLLRQATT
jgi:hypothetical protein